MVAPEKVLEKIPRRTPIWAVGLVTLIVATTVSVTSVYLIAKDDLRWFTTEHDREDTAKFKQQDDSLTAIINLVNSNAIQVTELSKTLGFVEHKNIMLTDRVEILEKDVAKLKDSLLTCEQALKACRNKGS